MDNLPNLTLPELEVLSVELQHQQDQTRALRQLVNEEITRRQTEQQCAARWERMSSDEREAWARMLQTPPATIAPGALGSGESFGKF